MLREGSFSPNRKETKAYLIRDLQMEYDCQSLEIMRVKIYMLIPKLVTLGNKVREKNSVIFLKQDPWELFPWLIYCVSMEELVQAVRTHSSTLSLKTGLRKSPLRPWLCNLTGSSNQHNTGLSYSFKKQLLLWAVLKLWRMILQWLWKCSFFCLNI